MTFIMITGIPDDLHKRIRLVCILEGVTINEKILSILEREFNVSENRQEPV